MLGTITATMQWAFYYTPSYTKVINLVVNGVPPGATVVVKCSGRGCPFAQHSSVLEKSTRSGRSPRMGFAHRTSFNVTPAFASRRLAVGTRVTVEIVRPNWIGNYYRFTMRAGRGPGVQHRLSRARRQRSGRRLLRPAQRARRSIGWRSDVRRCGRHHPAGQGRAADEEVCTRDGCLLAALAVLVVALGVTAAAGSRTSRPGHRTAVQTGAGPMIRVRPQPAPMVRPRAGPRRPAVVVQPRSVTIAAGHLVGFTAAASGNPAPRTQWQRSVNAGRTWANIRDAHRVTYTFTARSSETGSEYRAVFTNGAGRATTKAARLTIGRMRSPGSGNTTSPNGGGTGSGPGGLGGSGSSGGSGASGSTIAALPQIIVQPADQSVQNGDPATFITGATGVVTSTEWQVSTDAGTNWSDVPNATATTYAMIATAGENGYEYRAVLSNSAGSATTRAATLTVAGPPANSAPQVTTQPTNQTVADGDYATFTAAASGYPAPTTQWQTSSDGGQTWVPVLGAISTSYTFKPTTAQNGYEYRAVFSNFAGTATTNAATIVIASQSGNWSGYFALGQAFSAVTGSWSVPAVTCPTSATSYSSQWIGIDGAQSQTVEQDGTESDCFGGTPNYDAWYEMYGDNNVNSGYEVELQPGTYPVRARRRDDRLGQYRERHMDLSDQRHHGKLDLQHEHRVALARTRAVVGRVDRGATGGERLALDAVRLRECGVHERDGDERYGQRPDLFVLLRAGRDGRIERFGYTGSARLRRRRFHDDLGREQLRCSRSPHRRTSAPARDRL